jgi:spore coat polysaccharide biosynthesis protein SpsF
MAAKRSENRPYGAASEYGSVMAFLQARMGSTRLPGKVLMRIQGQSILERAIRRLSASLVVDEVVVLTTYLDEDDAVVEEAGRLGAWIYRGAVEDVLARFHKAAEIFNPDIIIRATADNPLIDIGSIERIVRKLRADKLDLCMEKELPYGAATEALMVGALSKTSREASEARHREHVTLYMKERPEEFRVCFMEPPGFLRHPEIRLTVDTPEDLLFMSRLISRLPEQEDPPDLREYLSLAISILCKRECKAQAAS